MSEKAKLAPCPFCGSEVAASYIGSSDWEVFHAKDGQAIEGHGCIEPTIYARASSADWDADENAEWNMMAAKWNRRSMP